MRIRKRDLTLTTETYLDDYQHYMSGEKSPNRSGSPSDILPVTRLILTTFFSRATAKAEDNLGPDAIETGEPAGAAIMFS